MRGKVTLQDVPCDSVGITPACAGKRKKCRKCRPGLGDHPRMCGEKKFTFDAGKLIPGSPPRMRGKAGSRSASGSACRDHPRVCGEKRHNVVCRFCRIGSPPRMRGKGIEQSNCRVRMRITPAYAGKRQTNCGINDRRRDHPRVCGEKTKKIP